MYGCIEVLADASRWLCDGLWRRATQSHGHVALLRVRLGMFGSNASVPGSGHQVSALRRFERPQLRDNLRLGRVHGVVEVPGLL